MEIVIHNDGMSGEDFHQLVSGETGDALRKTAKNYLGSENLSENQVKEIKRQGGADHEALIRKMTEHALSVVNLPLNSSLTLEIEFAGGEKA
ncbi:hypothetical protein [Salinicola rhizosphaerae]|uniref:Uncharacterized protein n=1 Tax=Salinicola rhizosphaerae TaxID=1443141 RepID=A0ABQ3EGN6_9GAMM|nr:hypothetical protein [Salinicola rhizosphaerae]GHB34088.1 hypothetical protein GCM10009038_36390 [Salinicola rhizosphaerae]